MRRSKTTRIQFDYDSESQRISAVLDALGWQRCNLFAHDYGGFLSLGFVNASPERVLRYAILNNRAHATFPGAAYWGTWMAGFVGRYLPWLVRYAPLTGIHRFGLRRYVADGSFDGAQLDRYLEFTPQAELTRISGGRHFIMEHRPVEVLSALQALLATTANS